MPTVELMEEEEDDTSRLCELIALEEAGLHGEEEYDTSRLNEFIALAEAELRAQEEKDEFMSQCDAGQCSKWNEVVVEDCATDDSED
jgi:hypothetical protein